MACSVAARTPIDIQGCEYELPFFFLAHPLRSNFQNDLEPYKGTPNFPPTFFLSAPFVLDEASARKREIEKFGIAIGCIL